MDQQREAPMPPPLSILVVDDMQYSRTVLRNTLERIGYDDVRLAGSAAEALDALAQRRADVVIADWVMPEMNGLELAAAIRRRDDEAGRYTSIILFTSKDEDKAMLQAFHEGADDFLTKPIQDVQLAARIYAAGRVAMLQNRLMETSSALETANRLLEQQSTTDPITALANQRALNQRLEALVLETQARGGGFCLALVSLDQQDDEQVSPHKDLSSEVLMGFARRLRLAVRPTDLVARIAEEEFALLMHVHSPEGFNRDLFKRVLASITRDGIQTSEGSVPILVSIGAHFHRSDQPLMTIRELMKQTRSNLNQARGQSGARVVVT
ncbi:GGDEF domain-containing response regulator [Ectothiorhodospira lacustris]|uniref:GGDEF domain-containing response regulator n=1 Tax=Ectothiorhodospira lacustris TaxID=2899127 RepID=UPI001EE7D326|nr:response regulator [Ectothiorhodospira lacustris]MCG5501492.1 response regulator [Ectothiorhodospira lacustris]MCG5510727.1 response regulator [Ectothiorhodospira lacustris]MCG5522373.1 response regulator [Ectothiorhodospira lacustris]